MRVNRAWWCVGVLGLSGMLGCDPEEEPSPAGPDGGAVFPMGDAGVPEPVEDLGARATDLGSEQPDLGSEEPWTPGVVTGTRCHDTGLVLTCDKNERTTPLGRKIFWQEPLGTPPSGGWPAVIVFQPSIYWAQAHWTGIKGVPLGQQYPTEMIRNLLDRGYVVITPQATELVNTVWQTNVPVVNGDWEATNDHAMMLELFDDLAAGVYGSVDENALFATGMSSGGYMTSRMALSYPGRFRALAIQSGAWATCLGPLDTATDSRGVGLLHACHTPSDMPADHPPTLFLHGSLDVVVGVSTMERYEEALRDQGTPTRKVLVPLRTHEFLRQTPSEVPAWFDQYLPSYFQSP